MTIENGNGYPRWRDFDSLRRDHDRFERDIEDLDRRVDELESVLDQQRGARNLVYILIGTNVLLAVSWLADFAGKLVSTLN